MRKRIGNQNVQYYLLVLMFLPCLVSGSTTTKISGFISDKVTKHPIPDANVFLLETNQGSASQEGGYYVIDRIKPGVYSIEVQVMGYQKEILHQIDLQQDQSLNIALEPTVIELAPVMITATLTEHLKSHVTVSADVITPARMKQLNGSTSGEILESMVGLYSKTSDGFAGVQTPSIRGSDANQIVIMMDGVRLNTAQGGGVDLNQIPIGALERIEIIRGGHSALIGADAVGGAIHLISKQTIKAEDLSYGIHSTIGSFGIRNIGTYGAHRFGPLSFLISYNRIQTDGNFKYLNPNTNKKQIRKNNDFESDNILAKAKFRINPKNNIRLIVQNIRVDKGNAGSVNLDWMGNSSLTPNSRSENTLRLLTLQSESQLTDILRLKEQFYYHTSKLHYTNPDGWVPVNDTHENRSMGLLCQGQLLVHHSISILTGLEIRQDKLKSTSYTPNDRNVQSLFVQPEIRYGLLLGSIKTQWAWIPSIRWDHYSDVKSNISPKLGLLVNTGDKTNIAVKGNMGHSFRVPNFDDLYWPEDPYSQGNPNLNPETSLNFDGSLQITRQGPIILQTELTYFNNSIKNLIQWAPTADDPNFWTPQNVGKAKITGFEAGVQLNLPKNRVSIRLVHTAMEAIDKMTNKRLIYRPDHKTDITAGLNLASVSINLNYRLVSERFADTANNLQLKSYKLLNGNISVGIRLKGLVIQTKLEGMNLFDKSIYIIDGYPTHGREFRLTMGITY